MNETRVHTDALRWSAWNVLLAAWQVSAGAGEPDSDCTQITDHVRDFALISRSASACSVLTDVHIWQEGAIALARYRGFLSTLGCFLAKVLDDGL